VWCTPLLHYTLLALPGVSLLRVVMDYAHRSDADRFMYGAHTFLPLGALRRYAAKA